MIKDYNAIFLEAQTVATREPSDGADAIRVNKDWKRVAIVPRILRLL
jgi:hypothetical protein